MIMMERNPSTAPFIEPHNLENAVLTHYIPNQYTLGHAHMPTPPRGMALDHISWGPGFDSQVGHGGLD